MKNITESDEDEDWMETMWAEPLNIGTVEKMSKALSTPNVSKEKLHPTISCSGSGDIVQRMSLNDNKAGMEGIDKGKINQIIHEASKGSKFYENEKLKEEQMKRRIEQQNRTINGITQEQLEEGTEEADRLLEDFEKHRDLSHVIVHIDMDAFYAAVEMRDNPSLNNKPMAVGGNAMLSTSNYHARKFGVRAAMPGFIAKKLCPELVIVPLNFEKYTAVSKQVKSLISEYDHNFCPMSLDEAYLDITEHLEKRKTMSDGERTFICRDSTYTYSVTHCLCDLNEVVKNYGSVTFSKGEAGHFTISSFFSNSISADNINISVSKNIETSTNVAENEKIMNIAKTMPVCPVCGKDFPFFSLTTFGVNDEETVRELRSRIEQRTRLTASAGIAPNMMLAKVCSDKNKPNGQYKIPATRNDVMKFIKDLPTRKISGIGKVSEAMLNTAGVYTCTDIYQKRGLLYHLYSPISFSYFMRICIGIGSTTVESDSERKSISTERTFSEINKPAELYKKCEELCQCLAEDLNAKELKGKTVAIKIKTVKFEVYTRAHTMCDYTNEVDEIQKVATELLRTEIMHCSPHPLRLRLMGVRMSNLLQQDLCDRKKQCTITGAFKKLSEITSCNETSLSIQSISKCEKWHSLSKEQQNHFENTLGIKCDNLSTTDAEENVGTDSVDVNCLPIESSINCCKENNSYVMSCDVDMHSSEKSKCNSISFLASTENDNCSSVLVDPVNIDSSIIKTQPETVVKKFNDAILDNKCDTIHASKPDYCPSNSIIIAKKRTTRSGQVGSPSINFCVKRRSSNNSKNKQIEQVIYVCPICSKNVICQDLEDFNEHVDQCLAMSPSLILSNPTVVMESALNKINNMDIVIPKDSDVKADDFSLNAARNNSEVYDYRITSQTNEHSDDVKENLPAVRDDENDVILDNKNPQVFNVGNSNFNNKTLCTEVENTNECKSLCDAATVEYNRVYCSAENQKPEILKEMIDDGSPVANNTNDTFTVPVCSEVMLHMTNSDTDVTNIGIHDINYNRNGCQDTDINAGCASESCQEVNNNEDEMTSLCASKLLSDAVCNRQNEIYQVCCTPDVEPKEFNKDLEVIFHTALSEDFQHPSEVSDVINNGMSQTEGLAVNYHTNSEDAALNSDSLLICPVCNIEQRVADLNEFNKHVDTCLSKGVISEILKEQRNVDKVSMKRSRESSMTPKPSKKHKTVVPSKSSAGRSILSFFSEQTNK